ncbi:hypothetical protein GCM10009682_23090 [Luedemannella flava]|uniref:Response regulatory domain-containing protein n=1 Tax=Luedemannella flava TaxID=349316 RepID=A0ABP4Y2N8_9ACTN
MLHQGNVLVVDDDEDLREIICRLLRRAGYTVRAAGTATEALPHCHPESGPLDLLVADLGLPGIDGLDLCDAARRLRADLAVLYVTGTPRAELDRLGLLPSDAAFVQKPFTAATLVSAVRAATTGHASPGHAA